MSKPFNSQDKKNVIIDPYAMFVNLIKIRYLIYSRTRYSEYASGFNYK